MILQYLGTAAAEGVPGVFCPCPACARARREGGREARMRSGAMVDGVLKIDFPPDAYAQALRFHLDFSSLAHVLVTHTHRDHFCPEEFAYRVPPYAHLPQDAPPVTVYGNEACGAMIAPYEKPGALAFCALSPGNAYDIAGYRVTAYRAVHAPGQTALFYAIEKGGKSLLYAHDTGCFTADHFQLFAGKRFSVVSMDCTYGAKPANHAFHMGVAENLRMREKLLECGAAGAQTRFVANHFSHNGVLPYEDMKRLLPGFEVSFDGMTIEF